MSPSSFPQHDQAGGGICIAVAAPDTRSAISSVQPVIGQADVVEIRLDAMREADIRELCKTISRPLLFTNRPRWEGGAFEGPEEERILPLLEAIQNRAAFVDLELKTSALLRNRLIEKLDGTQTRLILSHHNFAMTPDSAALSEILRQQVESGAHIGKIVTMAHDHFDVLRVLNLQCEAGRHNFPLIAFCMGEAGRLSRVATLLLGGFMAYAALDETQATAPGQLAVEELKSMLSCLQQRKNR
jgi:3-dehydroquinate dehydratase-1/3-dehydroquinate dehydratase/shikimate dehydrogenase